MELKYSVIFCVILLQLCAALPYRHPRCSSRLENALEHMRRRSLQVKSSRTLFAQTQTPYSIYHSLYGQQEGQAADDFYEGERGYYAKQMHRGDKNRPYSSEKMENPFQFDLPRLNQRQPHKFTVSRVDVEDLRVRIPPSASARWVEIDKCNFSNENSTLDTRLIFPDLTISGNVVMHPTGGKCHMILRLRHAGIEFHTIPIGFDNGGNEESRRTVPASVRTDSHFSEPGFISVFAHGCQGPTGIKVRQNSKRRYGFVGDPAAHAPLTPEIELSDPEVVLGNGNGKRWGKYHNPYQHAAYDIRSEQQNTNNNFDWSENQEPIELKRFLYGNGIRDVHDRHLRRHRRGVQYDGDVKRDEMTFNADILNINDDMEDLIEPDARAFTDIFSGNVDGGSNGGGALFASEHDQVDDAMTSELEKLFSMGVRGLLTTYMQRALQPAIKETLMENMGYTLSYG